MILGAGHRSPGICLRDEETLGKPQLGDSLMKELYEQSSPKWDPFPPHEGGRIAQHVRKGEGRIEGKDGAGYPTVSCRLRTHIVDLCGYHGSSVTFF